MVSLPASICADFTGFRGGINGESTDIDPIRVQRPVDREIVSPHRPARHAALCAAAAHRMDPVVSKDNRNGTASSTFSRMGSIAGFSSAVWARLRIDAPYAPRLVAGGWVVAGCAGLAYGLYLTVIAVHSPPRAELTGHWVLQPAFKASMAVLLAMAAVAHPIVRERRWLVAALLLSATGDWLLAIPWWAQSFVLGLGAFLFAHLCFIGALLPLCVPRAGARLPAIRVVAVAAIWLASGGMLAWFWPHLGQDNLTIPVTVYIFVLCAMVCAALVARLPTIWTAVGAVCFAASDAMIAIDRFILGDQALEVPIWVSYAAAAILITAGFFFGRGGASSRDRRRVSVES